jgi:hypothetical protein
MHAGAGSPKGVYGHNKHAAYGGGDADDGTAPHHARSPPQGLVDWSMLLH